MLEVLATTQFLIDAILTTLWESTMKLIPDNLYQITLKLRYLS